MPLQYRSERPRSPSHAPNNPPPSSPNPYSSSVIPRQSSPTPLGTVQLADADDSIVLSDLLRSGEASRLRRRGALRLERASLDAPRVDPRPARRRVMSLSPSLHPGGQFPALPSPRTWVPAPPPIASPILVPPSPSTMAPRNGDATFPRRHHHNDVDDDDDDDGEVYGEGDDDRFTPSWEQVDSSPTDEVFVPHPEPDPDLYNHVLFCGGEDPGPSSWWETDATPYEPSPLPWSSPSRPSVPVGRSPRYKCHPSRALSPRTNGCGAVVHLRAWRRERCSVWVGKDAASNAVVPMDVSYFETPGVRVVRSPCGCVREGVGCAIW